MLQEIKIPKTCAEALEVLNLANNVNDEEIKRAYKKCALKWHPDKWSSKSEEEQEKATENFKAISAAYGILTGEITEKFISNQTNDNWADELTKIFKEHANELRKKMYGSHLSEEEIDLFHALYTEDLEEVKILLGKVKNVNVISDRLDKAPLHHIVENACKNPNSGWKKLLEEVLSKHSPSNLTTAHTSNAIGCSKSSIIDINIQGNYTGTPLQIACELECPDVISIFLKYGANTNVCSKQHRTSLYYALKANMTDVAKMLFEHCAKIDFDYINEMLIVRNILKYSDDTVKMLLPHASDKQKNRMLQSICLSNKIESDRDIEVAGLLLREGADPQYSQYTEGEDITYCSASGWVIIKKKNRLQELFTQHNNGINNNLHQKQQDNQPHVDNTKHNQPQKQFTKQSVTPTPIQRKQPINDSPQTASNGTNNKGSLPHLDNTKHNSPQEQPTTLKSTSTSKTTTPTSAKQNQSTNGGSQPITGNAIPSQQTPVSNGPNNNLQQINQSYVKNKIHNDPKKQFLEVSPRGWAMIATGAIVGGVIGAILAATGVIPAIAAIGIIATAVLAGIVGAFAGAAVGSGIGYLTTDIVINRCCSGANVQAAA